MKDTLSKDVKELKEHIEGLSSQMRVVSFFFDVAFFVCFVFVFCALEVVSMHFRQFGAGHTTCRF